MEEIFGAYYTSDDLGERKLPDNTSYLEEHDVLRFGSKAAVELGKRFREMLLGGQRIYLIGFLATSHNSGLSLIEASVSGGIDIHCNYEEERFSQVKHHAGYPALSARELRAYMNRHGIAPSQIFGVFYAFDVIHEEQSGMRMLLKNGKIIKNKLYKFITESAVPSVNFDASQMSQIRKNLFSHSPALVAVFEQLCRDLDLPSGTKCVQMLHHESHAYFSYGASPFASNKYRDDTTMIACIDGAGDLSSVSTFVARGNEIKLLKRNSRVNSLGVFYMLCSSLLGGWAALSSEGRYMGAAAWGNRNRLTNPFYKQLRQFLHFGDNGMVHFNSAMSENEFGKLEQIVGPFVAMSDIWKPDAVINVDDVQHSDVTQRRVDIASAVQMVFEDGLCHIIADLIEITSSNQLVLCGGTALNCIANMRLLENFDTAYYSRYQKRNQALNLWVPPIPSDQGVVVGAPYQFAMTNGANPKGCLPTPFLCGLAPSGADIQDALGDVDFVESECLGNVHVRGERLEIADWMAYIVSQNGVIGMFQGEAETGPRALGHRSILSNPCNRKALEILNERVKLRERIRPLAPMVTLAAAEQWFELSKGAAAQDYDAYNYMVLTVKAREQAKSVIPAVIHYDGTSRVQIVREHNNQLIYDYLKALGRHIGVEVSINTSLNVGSPIVQTPLQALQIFRRSKGLDGIFMVDDSGVAYMVWAKPGVQTIDSDLPVLQRRYRAGTVRRGSHVTVGG